MALGRLMLAPPELPAGTRPDAAIRPLDWARVRLGIRNDSGSFLRAIYAYQEKAGETDVASFLADDSATE